MLLSLLVCDDDSSFYFEGIVVGEKRDRELYGSAWFWWICERVVK